MLFTSPLEGAHQEAASGGAETVFFEPSKDAGYGDTVALILAIVAGFMLPRWRDGLAISALLVLAIFALFLGLPTLVSGEPFSWAAFGYELFWVTVVLVYARFLLAFTFAYSLRHLIEFGWRAVRRRLQR